MLNRDAVFIDTSGWIALLHADDIDHSRATSVMMKKPLGPIFLQKASQQEFSPSVLVVLPGSNR